ncbi:hypothetical protein F5Y13DRAFT_197662 [Hypoxylon sp. FL1857]|nr:hypothetical protein F5Y13DRAFT_197662 [Hypoxylon sp. FL1857]
MSPSPPSVVPSSQSRTETSFKERLDQAAEEARRPDDTNEIHQPSLTEKITECVPAAAKILGIAGQAEPEATSPKCVSGPPDRPYHDKHIEEFVREQYRSKAKDDGVSD